MKTQLMRLNHLNKNGRIYTPESLEKFLEKGKEYYGEIGYPQSTIVDLGKVSHRVHDLRIEDDILVGEVEILSTPNGKTLKSILSEVVFRPRGMGNVNEQSKQVEDFQLLSFDAIPKDQDVFNLNDY
jgi:hypothetical protein